MRVSYSGYEGELLLLEVDDELIGMATGERVRCYYALRIRLDDEAIVEFEHINAKGIVWL